MIFDLSFSVLTTHKRICLVDYCLIILRDDHTIKTQTEDEIVLVKKFFFVASKFTCVWF